MRAASTSSTSPKPRSHRSGNSVFYDELEHVTVMRNFLNDPDGHLRDLLAEDE